VADDVLNIFSLCFLLVRHKGCGSPSSGWCGDGVSNTIETNSSSPDVGLLVIISMCWPAKYLLISLLLALSSYVTAQCLSVCLSCWSIVSAMFSWFVAVQAWVTDISRHLPHATAAGSMMLWSEGGGSPHLLFFKVLVAGNFWLASEPRVPSMLCHCLGDGNGMQPVGNSRIVTRVQMIMIMILNVNLYSA